MPDDGSPPPVSGDGAEIGRRASELIRAVNAFVHSGQTAEPEAGPSPSQQAAVDAYHRLLARVSDQLYDIQQGRRHPEKHHPLQARISADFAARVESPDLTPSQAGRGCVPCE